MRIMSSPQVFLSERANDVARWFRGELPSEVVKRNDARTVWRAGSEPPRLYVKRFPPSLFRDRATAEARMLQTLAQAGIPSRRGWSQATERSGGSRTRGSTTRISTWETSSPAAGPST